MTQVGLPTLDQLKVFLTVVETGSLAAAARKLNRAVSVMSYSISNLEAQLGVTLFVREGTKRPVLTEAGRAIMSDVHSVAQGIDGLQAKVTGLLQGLEAEVNLAVDVMLPSGRLGRILREFSSTFPTVSLRLHVEALGAVTALVLDRRAVIGISGPLSAGIDGIDSVYAGNVTMIPVAAPDHPLSKIGEVSSGEARKHVQLVLTDRSPLTEGRDFSVLSPRTWRLADLGAKHALLREGIGWGNMPLPMVERDLAGGDLVRLKMRDHPGGTYRLAGIWRRDAPPGPAASWLLNQFEVLGAGDEIPPDLPDI
jgi:DNA-binding transcriptional LysR family regulator